jgi:hypothetical protein
MMKTDEARKKDMIARRARGETLASIANDYKITRERVRQLIKKAGGPDRNEASAAKAAAHARADRDTLERIRAVMSAGTYEPGRIAKVLGLSEAELFRIARPADKRRFVRHVIQPKRWSDAVILKALGAASSGRSTLTTAEYIAARDAGDIQGPTVTVIIHRFGTWVNALERVNLTASRKSGRGRSITKKKALEDLARFYGRNGTGFSAAHYERWAKKNGAASQGTIRNIFGSWSEAKLQAMRVIK